MWYKPKPVAVIPRVCLIDSFTGLPLWLPYKPDMFHLNNQVAAAIHRFGRDMPAIVRSRMEDFVLFAKSFIIRHFVPVQEVDVEDFGVWLESTPYTEDRKKYFGRVYRELWAHNRKVPHSESFIKDEDYPEPKNPRAINSPSDASKVILARIMKAVDKATFKKKWFVKGSNPRTWSDKLEAAFGKNPVMGTDFSSFEAHHRDRYSDVILFWVMHMIRNCGFCNHFKRLVIRLMTGSNLTKFSMIEAKVDKRLMSGAMWTSSANGMLNLLFMSYLNGRTVAPEAPIEWLVENVDSYFAGFVEGDDGICLDRNINKNLITDLGLDLKWSPAPNYGDSSFCGIVCDIKHRKIVGDPCKVLRKFFSLPSKYQSARESIKLSLLRAKALSYKTIFNDCPIIGPLCQWVCDKTRGMHVQRVMSETDARKRDMLQIALEEKLWNVRPNIAETCRLQVEKHFGIDPHTQISMENEIYASCGDQIVLSLSSYSKLKDGKVVPLVTALDLKHLSKLVDPGGPAPSRIIVTPDAIKEVCKVGLKPTSRSKCKGIDREYDDKIHPQMWPDVTVRTNLC